MLIAALLLVLIYLQAFNKRHNDQLNHSLTVFGGIFEDAITTRLNMLHDLEALVQTNPNIQASDFEKLAQELNARHPGLRSLQLAKNNIVSHIYPQTTNYKVLGHNLFLDPERSVAVKLAISLRSPVIDGPLTLRQGGAAILLRLPIFIKNEKNEGGEYQWGVATAIMNWKDFIKETGLADLSSTSHVSIRKQIPVKQWGAAFWGDGEIFTKPNEVIELGVLNERWQIAMFVDRNVIHKEINIIIAIVILALVSLLYASHDKLPFVGEMHAGVIFSVSAVILVALLLGLIYLGAVREQRQELNTDLQSTHLAIRSRLKMHQDYFRELSREIDNKKLKIYNLNTRTKSFLSDNHEVEKIIYVDDQFRINAVSSLESNNHLIGSDIISRESTMSSALARELRQPVYTSYFLDVQGRNAFEMWFPVIHRGQFVGFLTSTYLLEEILKQNTPPNIRVRYETNIVNYNGQVIESAANNNQQLSTVEGQILIEPPSNDLSLQMKLYASNILTVERLIYSALLLFAIAVIIWDFYRLNIVYETLEQKVKERTTELESSNKELIDRELQAREAEAKIKHLANHDALTGLPSLRLARTHMEEVLKLAKRHGWKVAIMFIDLDGFKQVNDSLGHEAGDRLLQEISTRLASEMRETDTVARIGGDEFVVIQTEVHDVKAISMVAERLLKQISKPMTIYKHEVCTSGSIGIAIYPEHGTDEKTLLNNADKAMYSIKNAGKNSFCFADHYL